MFPTPLRGVGATPTPWSRPGRCDYFRLLRISAENSFDPPPGRPSGAAEPSSWGFGGGSPRFW